MSDNDDSWAELGKHTRAPVQRSASNQPAVKGNHKNSARKELGKSKTVPNDELEVEFPGLKHGDVDISGYGFDVRHNEEVNILNDLENDWRNMPDVNPNCRMRVQRLLEMWKEQRLIDEAQMYEGEFSIEASVAASVAASKKEKKEKKKKKEKVQPLHMQAFVAQRKRRINQELGIVWEDEEKAREAKAKKLKAQLEDENEDGKCRVFRDNDIWKIWWDNSVLILAVINAFAVPVELSVYQELSNIQLYVTIDLAINVVFLIDLVIAFNTAYFNNEGELVR